MGLNKKYYTLLLQFPMMFFNAATRKCSITSVIWARFPLGHTALGRTMVSTPSFGPPHAPAGSPHKFCCTGWGSGATFFPHDSQPPGEHTASSGLQSSLSSRPWALPPWLPRHLPPGPRVLLSPVPSLLSHSCPFPAPPVSSTIKRDITPALHSSGSSLCVQMPLPSGALPLQ